MVTTLVIVPGTATELAALSRLIAPPSLTVTLLAGHAVLSDEVIPLSVNDVNVTGYGFGNADRPA